MTLIGKPPSRSPIYPADFAGECSPQPNAFQTLTRIHYLVDHLVSVSALNQRLTDLSDQFQAPKSRVWQPIAWEKISTQQIVGVDPEFYCIILAKSAEIELPSMGYGVESRTYLGQVCPRMARFMGGIRDDSGKVKEFGVWEKEEQTHGPILQNIYKTLTGKKAMVSPAALRGYCPEGNLEQDAYHHLVFRMAHECMAVSGYIALIALSTGELQRVLLQITQDEISHMAKFFGFTRWRFKDSFFSRFSGMVRSTAYLTQSQMQEREFFDTFKISKDIIKLWLLYEWSKMLVLRQLWIWDRSLTPDFLDELFAAH